MSDEEAEFGATQRDAGDGPPGATATFPYDRMTVERFREAFPRARWRDDLRAWFVPGPTAERRLRAWSGREWAGVLAHADARGRDAYAFEPIASPYLVLEDGFVIRTPYSRAVIEELRAVPWAAWDPDAKAWRVPFRSYEDLRRRWPAIEEAAHRAEPDERRRRAAARRAAPGHDDARDDGREDGRAEAAERRRHRYPVPDAAPPPFGRVLMTHSGPAVFEEVAGELVDPAAAARFYPGVAREDVTLVWAGWRRPTHAELVGAWPARTAPGPADLARGWWQPTITTLRDERRKAASLERARATRRTGVREPQ